MNIYHAKFSATCPNNNQTIGYNLRIESQHVIMVEDITKECAEAAKLGKPYHETMADYLHSRLGGKQHMTGFHHGVLIETYRG